MKIIKQSESIEINRREQTAWEDMSDFLCRVAVEATDDDILSLVNTAYEALEVLFENYIFEEN